MEEILYQMNKADFLQALELQRNYLSEAEFCTFAELAEDKAQDFDNLRVILALVIKSKPYKI